MDPSFGFGIVTKARISRFDRHQGNYATFPHEHLANELEKDWSLDASLYKETRLREELQLELPLKVIRDGGPELFEIVSTMLEFDFETIYHERVVKWLSAPKSTSGFVDEDHYFSNLCFLFEDPQPRTKLLRLWKEEFKPTFRIDFEVIDLKKLAKPKFGGIEDLFRLSHFCMRKAFPNNGLIGALTTYVSV